MVVTGNDGAAALTPAHAREAGGHGAAEAGGEVEGDVDGDVGGDVGGLGEGSGLVGAVGWSDMKMAACATTQAS